MNVDEAVSKLNLSFNVSHVKPSPGVKTINVHDQCAGFLGEPILNLCLVIIGFNFLIWLFWPYLKNLEFQIGQKKFTVLYFYPVINIIFAVMLFVYVYNGV